MSSPETRVYLDHNATSPLRREAREAVASALERCGNASSLHAEGREARARVEDARSDVARLLGFEPKQVVFTSGGSEAIAAAIHGTLARATPGRRRVVVSSIEHSSVLEGVRLAARRGRAGAAAFEIDEVPCARNGRVDAEIFLSRLGTDVALAALQAANNETGVLQPVEAVGPGCRKAGVPFLLDAVQVAGKVPLGSLAARADLVAISSHKMGGPQGAGALALRDGVTLEALIPGGAQERRRRGGTEAVASIAGFGAAAATAAAEMQDDEIWLESLRARLESGLKDRFPQVRVHGHDAPRLASTVSFAIKGVAGELLAIALDLAGFAVSTGSACASGAVLPSHVLRAMGYTEAESKETVRVSMGWSTTRQDVERFLEALPPVVERLLRAAPAPSVS